MAINVAHRLSPLPWQHDPWRNLTEQHLQSRPAHALLFVGASGLGKRHLAMALAYWLLCRQPQVVDQQPQACGQCRSCRQLHSGVHPDVHHIAPEAADKPLKVDQIRGLSDFMQHSSQFGAYRIALLDSAERLNPQAANALLKTLEEPPAQRLIILLAESLAGLPATVRSRCQRLNFSRPGFEQALPWLQSQWGQLSKSLPADATPELVLSLAGGAPLRALAMAHSEELTQRRECFADYQQVIHRRLSPDQWANRWAKQPQVVEWLLTWQQDMIRLKFCQTSPPRLAHPDLAESLRQLSHTLPAEQLFAQLQAIQTLPRLLNVAVNVPLQLAALLSRF